MTTTVKITNKAQSNGDVHVRGIGINTWAGGMSRIAPGQSAEIGVTDSSILSVFETMPNTGPNEAERTSLYYGELADQMIAKEVAGQDKMWGPANERTDSANGQLLAAGVAQAAALLDRRVHGSPIDYRTPPTIYPSDWSGFRDYGSDVANLVVAVAYLRQEIKRLVANEADTTRLTRNEANQPYRYDQPAQAFPADPNAPVADAAAAIAD